MDELVRVVIRELLQQPSGGLLNTGSNYRDGLGCEQSYERALECFEAARQGNAGAESALGTCYSKGSGVPQSCERAVEWFKKCAAKGDMTAQ